MDDSCSSNSNLLCSETDTVLPHLSISTRLDGSKHKKVECHICGSLISVKNIRRHLKTHKSSTQVTVVCVDKPHGIFLVDPQCQGKVAPVHVKLKTFGSMALQCSLKDCKTVAGPTSRGHHSFVCRHVLSAINSVSPAEPMQLGSIDNLIMSESMKTRIENLNAQALEKGFNTIVKYPDCVNGEYFSVFSGRDNYNSTFGRVLVSRKDNILRCPCSGSRHNCVHKAIVRWALNIEETEETYIDENNIETSSSLEEIMYERIREDDIVSFDQYTDWSTLEPTERYCTDCGHQLARCPVTNSSKIVDQSFVKAGIGLVLYLFL